MYHRGIIERMAAEVFYEVYALLSGFPFKSLVYNECPDLVNNCLLSEVIDIGQHYGTETAHQVLEIINQQISKPINPQRLLWKV